MASLDFPTIAIVGLLLNIGLAVGFSLILLVMRGHPVPRLWAASLWASALSTVLLGLQLHMPELASILARNAFAVLGSMLMLFGVALHVGRRAPVRPALDTSAQRAVSTSPRRPGATKSTLKPEATVSSSYELQA